MSAEVLASMVQSLGFPVVICGVLMYFIKYIIDKNREDVNKLNEQHQSEMKEITTAINNNTIAITKLCEKLEVGDRAA